MQGEEVTEAQIESEAGSKVSLEEGELYTVRRNRLVHVPRRDDDGMRRVRITESAYEASQAVGYRMRKNLNGYKPDVSLVVSALVEAAARDAESCEDAVRQMVLRMFERPQTIEAGSESRVAA